MKQDDLTNHLNNLKRDDCYRVEKVLKKSPHETTEIVYFVGSNGAEQGPYIRKYLSSSLGLGSAYGALFEAWQSGRRFKHIPFVFDCFETGEFLAVIMEYVVGETLQDVMYREGPSLALAVDVMPQILDALIELHESFPTPVIHRDLKPSNIMLAQKSLTLIDFGISRIYDEGAVKDTNHFGTRTYAPPEQFGFGQTDVRSDVYSLGVLLYYCLTGEVPSPSIQDKGVPDARIPEPLRYIITTSTELDPRQRYATVREMKEAFLSAAAYLHAPPGTSFVAPPLTSQQTAPPTHHIRKQEQRGISKGTNTFQDFSLQPIHRQKPRRAGLLSRIPRPIGIAWNILILVFFLLVLIVCFSLTINPLPDYENIPIYGRAALYGSILLFFCGPVVFFLLDKRMFERFIPALARLSLPKQFAISLSVFIIGFVTICFLIVAFL